MISLKSTLISSALIGTLIAGAAYAEETKNELQYIEKNDKGNYILHMTKPGTGTSDMNAFFNGTNSRSNDKIFRNDALEIWNIGRVGGKLQVEKRYTESSTGGVVNEITELTNEIVFRNEDDTRMLGSKEIEYKNYGSVVLIKLNKNINDIEKYGILGINEYKLNINGKDVDVVKDDGTKSDTKKCYIIDEGIICSSSIFENYENNVALKIDGLSSSSLYVRKESFMLGKPDTITTEDEGGTRYIKLSFARPKVLNNVNNLTAIINNSEAPNGSLLINSSMLSLRFDMKLLKKEDRFVSITVKDKVDNTFSNPIFVNIEKEFVPEIKKVSVSESNREELRFVLDGNLKGLIGDTEKIKVNMNGADYSFQGEKEPVMENGVQKTDQYGNPVYSYRNKINVAKNMDGTFIFSFKKASLKPENVFWIKNENTGVDSNMVSFSGSKYDSFDYSYSTGSVAKQTKENLVYENGKLISLKGIDFLNKPENTINLGKLNINNLKDYQVYKVAFDVKSDNEVNPFSALKLNATNLQIGSAQGSAMNYRYEVIGLGKDILSGDLIGNINELFNLDKDAVKFEMSGFIIESLGKDGNFKRVFTSSNKYNSTLAYDYEFGNCFEGNGSYCSLNGLKKPGMMLELTFGDVIAGSANPTAQDGVVIENKKNNFEIYMLAFKSEKNKSLNTKLKKLYDLIIAKGVTARQKTTLKNSINTIIRSLKDIEDNKSKIAAASSIKASIKNIKGILASLKKS